MTVSDTEAAEQDTCGLFFWCRLVFCYVHSL